MVSPTSKLLRLLLASMLGTGLTVVWPAVPAAAPQNQETPEVKSEETTPTFTVRAQRNEVLVRVIVRDANGNAVRGLTKDDFRLFDNGKPQSVTAFSVENNQPAQAVKPPAPASAPAQSAEPVEAEPVLALPERYVAFYFDDLVVSFEDMVRVREAAGKFIESSLQPTDRAGIFTSSGLGVLDFTADRTKLRQALANLRPRPRNLAAENDCPPLTPYEAYVIDQEHDPIMLNIAAWEYIVCACGRDPILCPNPQSQAQNAAMRAWINNQTQSRQSLRVLLDLVRRMGSLPGQRSILWLSQGFLTFELHSDLNELTDRALREHVVINALDSRGLWVNIPGGDASENNVLPHPAMSATADAYRATGKSMNQDVMAQVSHDTGGIFIRNTNDYDGGFRKAGALPEFSYLLAFSPQNLKYDGKFHKLKVELVNPQGLSLQARNGYFARNEALHPEERARQEIEDAVFSRQEYREFPVDLHTQFFKLNTTEAQLSVVARVDAHAMQFHKEGERNLGSLKMVCAAFDRDGNLAAGIERSVELKLRDATFAHVLSAGLNIRGELKLSGGTYAIRVVVYQIDSAQVTALNRTVEIPF
jgi:VWFA-related protein